MSNRPNKVEEIVKALKLAREPEFRQKQVIRNVYKTTYKTFEEMTDLPKGIRDRLSDSIPNILSLKVINVEKDEYTQKVLFHTESNSPVEAVLMDYEKHSTICISSHSGCPLGCEFCATGKMPINKALNIDEITDQVLYFIKQDKRPDNIVIMGMGEPLINPIIFDVLNIFMDEEYFGYGQRRISISTVGIVPSLLRLNKDFPQVNVAFSMHSPFDEEREKLMPINKAYPIHDVFSALRKHVQNSHRKVFISYILLKNVNDSDEHADKIAELINRQGEYKYLFHVNLIKFHKFEPSRFEASFQDKIKHFSYLLKRKGISNTIRKDFGEEISGACGQLAGTDTIN